MITFTLTNRSRPKATVTMLVFFCAHRYRMTIGVGLPAKYWSDKKHRAKITTEYDGSNINAIIQRFEDAATAFLRECSRVQTIPTDAEFREAITKATRAHLSPEKAKDKQSLTHYIETVYIPRYSSVRAHRTIDGYKNELNHLRQYERDRGVTLTFPDINIDFYNSFREWFFLPRDGRVYSLNYFGNMVKFVKQVFREARDVDHLHQSDGISHRNFIKCQELGASIYLTTEELSLIESCILPSENLSFVRDVFLLGCYTGLRISDLRHLSADNFDGQFLRLRTVKTKDNLVIPLHPVVRKLIDKGFFGHPRKIYEQKINEGIKTVCRLAGLTDEVTIRRTEGSQTASITRPKCDLVTCHTARRSFATNAYKMGVPTIAIMKITGHKLESTFMRYIKVSEEENAQIVAASPFFSGPKLEKG